VAVAIQVEITGNVLQLWLQLDGYREGRGAALEGAAKGATPSRSLVGVKVVLLLLVNVLARNWGIFQARYY
jgi:hypothetical protein